MLTVDVQKNKEQFINYVKKITRMTNEESERLIFKLSNSDFFTAPYTTKYQYSYEGGLCAYSLKVYEKLSELFSKDIKDETLLILGLFCGLSKMNFYEPVVINKKVYSDNGTKSDNLGKFDWKSEYSYKVRDAENRYIFGTPGQTTERMLSYFLPLTEEESIALISFP